MVVHINSLWMFKNMAHQINYFIHATPHYRNGDSSFYWMQQIRITFQTALVNSSVFLSGFMNNLIISKISVHWSTSRVDWKCSTTVIGVDVQLLKPGAFIERRKRSTKSFKLSHKDDDNFIINSASLSAQAAHCRILNLNFAPIQLLEWINELHDGFKNWGTAAGNKQKRKRVHAAPSTLTAVMDPGLDDYSKWFFANNLFCTFSGRVSLWGTCWNACGACQVHLNLPE